MKKFRYVCLVQKCMWRHDSGCGGDAFCVLPTCPRGFRRLLKDSTYYYLMRQAERGENDGDKDRAE